MIGMGCVCDCDQPMRISAKMKTVLEIMSGQRINFLNMCKNMII